MDNGQHERHDGLFRGALDSLRSTTDPKRTIAIAFAGYANYGSKPDASDDLRERPWMHFETVPPKGQGALSVTHNISLERLFRNSRDLKAADIQPGEKFRVGMNPKRAFRCGWWAFGDMEIGDLKDKKFAVWVLPDKDGNIYNLMPDDERPSIERMEKDGWVSSQHLDDLEMTEDEAGSEVIVEFFE